MREIKQFNNHMTKVRRYIRKLAGNSVFDNKEIILFGTIKAVVPILKCLAAEHLQVTAFVDNSMEKQGKYCFGYKIYSPEEYLPSRKGKAIVLIFSAEYFYEMAQQLEELEFAKDVDYFIIGNLSIKKMPILLREFTSLIKILAGYCHYKQIMKNRGDRCNMLLCPYPGTGDTYMIGIYLQQYLAQSGIEEYVFVVNGSTSLKIAKIFAIDNITVINERQKDRLLALYQFMTPKGIKIKPLLFWDWRTRRHVNYIELQITFDDDFKFDVFELDADTKKNSPATIANEAAINEIFDKHDLVKGKTVILAPYAGIKFFEMPNAVWEKIATVLEERGYCVCTNSSGDDEPAIEGTTPVFFPFADAVEFVNQAGYFIGVRSGLCDILSTSTSKMVIIYESVTTFLPMRYFSLRRMGLNEAAIEIEYDGSDDEYFLNKLLDNF